MMSWLIGYYSISKDAGPGSLLDRIILNHSIPSVERVSLRNTSSLPFAEIACAGAHSRSHTSGDRISVCFSASGLAHHKDAEAIIRDGSLAIRRDIFGRVPIFWTRTQDAVWFASNTGLLLPLTREHRVSLEALYGYTCFSYVPTPLTAIEGIHSVAAGRRLTWQIDSTSRSIKLIEEQVEDWSEARSLIDAEREAVSRVKRLLEESINDSLPDPREPVGVFLSGGLDSSISAALLARAGARVRAYALDFGSYGLSELPYAEAVAKALHIPLTKVDAAPARISKAIEPAAHALDQPYGDGVTIPLYLLGETASRESSIVFNGEGGDQLFAGWANKPLIASGVYRLHTPETSDLRSQYLRTFHRLHGHESDVFNGEALDCVKAIDPFRWIEGALDSSRAQAFIHRLRRANLMLKGAQNIQPRATGLALAQGLMVRSPFCYKPLAEDTFEVAGRLFLRGPCEKYLLKKAVEDWLPQEVVWREKRGMGVPLTQWLLGPLRRDAGRWLSPRALRDEGRLKADIALRIASGQLSGHIQGRRVGENLWMLVMWQAWRKFVLGEKLPLAPINEFLLPRMLWQWRAERLRD